MRDIELILKRETDKFKNRAPKADRTLVGLNKRLEYVSDNMQILTKKVTKLINEHISNNGINDAQIKEIQEYSADYLSNFFASIIN